MADPHHFSNFIVKLQNAWVSEFYRKHLKKYAIARLLALRFWLLLSYIYKMYNGKSYTIIPLQEFSTIYHTKIYKVAEASVVDTPTPQVFPESLKQYMRSPHTSYNFPEVYVSVIPNATTFGDTNLVIARNMIVHHDQYDFKRDLTFEEYRSYSLVNPTRKKIKWLLKDDAPRYIPVAATFSDAASMNYAHWLTEVLPRISLFCSDDRFADIPIIINDGLHRNIMESARLAAGSNREIITLPAGKALSVGELYVTSASGYASCDPRGKKSPDHPQGQFNVHGLGSIRSKCLSAVAGTPSPSQSKMIYLRRNSVHRSLVNNDAIERELVARGFSVVELEKFSFLEQVAILNSADVIVGPAGASFANIIFCHSGAQVVILAQANHDLSYFYWQNMARPFGVNISYVFGHSLSDGTQSDYEIKPEHVIEALGEVSPGPRTAAKTA